MHISDLLIRSLRGYFCGPARTEHVNGFISLVVEDCMPLVFSQAIPTPFCSYRVVEELYGVPEGWTEDGAPPPSTAMKFRMAICHDRMADIEQKI